MSEPSKKIEIKIYEQKRLVLSTIVQGRIEIGRQQAGEPKPYHFSNSDSRDRIVIADQNVVTVSRRQASFEHQNDGQLIITNLGSSLSLALADGTAIDPGATFQASLPSVVQVGNTVVRILKSSDDAIGSSRIKRLASPTMLPGAMKASSLKFSQFALPSRIQQDQVDGDHDDQGKALLLDWLQATMSVFQSAASSEEFISDAAKAVADIAQLDYAAVLTYSKDRWDIAAFRSPGSMVDANIWRPSTTVLGEVLASKSTVRQVPSTEDDEKGSLAAVDSLVASPILDPNGNVIGALYGDRRAKVGVVDDTISELEARLVDLLACGVSTGLARLEQEKSAVAARVQFEQFFTPELTRQLELDPDLLEGREMEVTLFFCDLRRFSRFSEILGPQRTFEFINDFMGVLSDCVLSRQGVLVDYIGDELMAMWGAPVACQSHAARACQAAIDALERLPELNDRWRSRLGSEFEFGIGINSGIARVGNAGSSRKFKYGPIGNAVNLASRVQNATKQIGVRFMVSGATASKLGPEFQTRRLCRVRVFNIEEPTDLYEVAESQQTSWIPYRDTYAEALDALERDDCTTAIHLAGKLVKYLPDDGPTLLLLSRAIDRARNPDTPLDPIWSLDRK